jgi:hypothetical protein
MDRPPDILNQLLIASAARRPPPALRGNCTSRGFCVFFGLTPQSPENKGRDLQDFLDRSVLRGKIMMPAQPWFFYIYENNEV